MQKTATTINQMWTSIDYDVLLKKTKSYLKEYSLYVDDPTEIINDTIIECSNTFIKQNKKINSYEAYIVFAIRNRILEIRSNSTKNVSIQKMNESETNEFSFLEKSLYEDSVNDSIRKHELGKVFKIMQDLLEKESLLNPKKITPLQIHIFKYYFILGISYRKLSERLHYSISFISRAVKTCKDIIKEKINKNYLNNFKYEY